MALESFDEISRWLASNAVVSGMRFEDLVLRLLREQGAEVVQTPDFMKGDVGYDAAFSLGGLPEIVLVEAKSGDLDHQKLTWFGRRLQKSMRERNVGLGLLVYHDEFGRRFPDFNFPSVIAIEIEDLLHRLRRHDLRRVITDQLTEVPE
ncbi:hypothetical protein [Micromonospora sp. CB01531]|uniref:hypothetical protein n=1 Tax=Micromonospora sp. CB01531 TaxID=1718947 RepID=UPI00096836A2|nr:hypothetical protein [Micromonospora sp. CB01531]OKI85931.1 hypothetical protein A6A27_40030 [Micromonospora sp. CB01531]